jgi:uncharacterized protein involved in response to NO
VNCLGLYGFLVPVSVMMSARTFPLYFRTPLPRWRALHAGLGVLLLGLALRLGGLEAGAALQAAALVAFVFGLGVFAARRPLPREPVRPLSDPIGLHAASAYGWLAVTAALLALVALDAPGAGLAARAAGAELHALGAGFVTLLILGMAAHMLPGFARRPVRSHGLIWLTLALGNLAALLRTVPMLVRLPGSAGTMMLAGAGVAGALAIAVLAANIAAPGVQRRGV